MASAHDPRMHYFLSRYVALSLLCLTLACSSTSSTSPSKTEVIDACQKDFKFATSNCKASFDECGKASMGSKGTADCYDSDAMCKDQAVSSSIACLSPTLTNAEKWREPLSRFDEYARLASRD
jgi:hypothetical protein